MKKVIVKGEACTLTLGQRLGQLLQANDVLVLEGDLGAGKTTFTKGIAMGLGVKRIVNSPTFTIMKQYQGAKLPLYHFDVYRLANSEEDFGFDEFFYGSGVTIVEWAHLIQSQLPDQLLEVQIAYASDDSRMYSFIAKGARYETLLKELSFDECAGD